MKYAVFFATILGTVVLYTSATLERKPTEHWNLRREVAEGRFEPVTTTAIVTALAPVALNLLTGLIGNLFSKPNDIEERVIYGRPMQVKLCGTDNCIQLLDKGSGLTTVGKGDTVQHALGDAVGAMLTTLLEKRLLSFHDLCREHIHFPHPDTYNCPGVEINTCDLSKPVLPAPACVDTFGAAYCTKMRSHCTESSYETFMMSNCYKTCTNNCYKPPPGPCDY